MKIVRRHKNEDWQLYHIAEDATELNDSAAQYPEIVHRLDSMWQAWAKRVHVFPKPD